MKFDWVYPVGIYDGKPYAFFFMSNPAIYRAHTEKSALFAPKAETLNNYRFGVSTEDLYADMYGYQNADEITDFKYFMSYGGKRDTDEELWARFWEMLDTYITKGDGEHVAAAIYFVRERKINSVIA